MRTKSVLALLLSLVVLPQYVGAQQTIPYFSSRCIDSPTGPSLTCHWQNADLTCTWGGGIVSTSAAFRCYPPGGTSQKCIRATATKQPGTERCVLIVTSRCCANNIDMNASCTAPTSSETTTTISTIPCC